MYKIVFPFLFLFFCSLLHAETLKGSRPNIILIITDDQDVSENVDKISTEETKKDVDINTLLETASLENGKKIAGKFDLYKIDAEGSEIDILKCFKKVDLKKSDFVMEISTEKNAKELWNKFKHLKIYSQKNSWKRVTKLDHIPTSHLEGSIIISESINW